MTTTNPHVQASNNSASSYEGIIDAFNLLRVTNGEQATSYPASYQGIIRAVLDLKKWGQAGGGTTTPGWVPEYDEDGNVVGGGYNPFPQQGSLWFDQRQGRLFVWESDGWYQTNGGDGLPAAQSNPPDTEVLGSLWYNTSNNSLYIWDGLSWQLVSANEGAVNTATLPLANPTREIPSAANFALLPDSTGMGVQSDLNTWILDSLKTLEHAVIDGENRPVHTSTTPPIASVEGDLWFDTDRLELMVKYDSYWVTSNLPLTDNTDFNLLSSTVQANAVSFNSTTNAVNARITAIENAPARVLTLSADTSALVFSDSEGKSSQVSLTGRNGIDVIKSGGAGFIIDALSLKTELTAAISTSNNTDVVNDLKYRTTGLEAEVAQLKTNNLTNTDALMNNTSNSGLNKIYVEERIATYQSALRGIKAALDSASCFDDFKASALTSLGSV